jgi:hypothetical protein
MTSISAKPLALKQKLFAMTIRPFDLMSRRHPLSSTSAIAPVTAPALLPA